MHFILLIVVAFLVATESKVMLNLFDGKNHDRFATKGLEENEDESGFSRPLVDPENDHGIDSDERSTEGRLETDDDKSRFSGHDDSAEATTALTAPCHGDTGFADVQLNSLDNVGLYQQYGIDSSTYYNAQFLTNTLEAIKTLPESDVSIAVAKADKLGFFTKHLKQSDTLKKVTSEALRELNGTALEELAKFKVAFTLQSNAILYLKTVMALDRIKDEHGEMKPKAFRKSKESRKVAQLIRRLENTVDLLRRSLTKPELISYGDIEDKIDLLKKDGVLAQNLAVLEKDEDWVEDKISEFLEGHRQSKEIEEQKN